MIILREPSQDREDPSDQGPGDAGDGDLRPAPGLLQSLSVPGPDTLDTPYHKLRRASHVIISGQRERELALCDPDPRSPPDPGQAAAAAETELCPGEASPGGGHLLRSLLHNVPLPAGLLRVRDHHGRVRGAEHAQLPGQHHPGVADCPGRHHLHPVHHPLLWRHKHLLSGRIRNICKCLSDISMFRVAC